MAGTRKGLTVDLYVEVDITSDTEATADVNAIAVMPREAAPATQQPRTRPASEELAAVRENTDDPGNKNNATCCCFCF